MDYLFEHFQDSSFASHDERLAIAMNDRDDVVHEILLQDDELDSDDAENMTPFQRIDKWLQWEGICGYTEDIIKLVVRAIGLGLTEEEVEAILDER